MPPGDVIQSEMDARWAWEHLRGHYERLIEFLRDPPESLSPEDRELIRHMAGLILGAMWNAKAAGELSRLRPPPAADGESPAELARRLAELLEKPAPSPPLEP